MMPRHTAAPARRYITRQHLERVALGKALSRDLTNDDGHIYIDISWYKHLSPRDVDDLCNALESWPAKEYLGKTRQVVLLVKKPKKPVTPANLRGITLAPHISKVEPTAYFDTRDQEVYERVLGGPYIVGGMKGVLIVEVIRITLFVHNMAMMAGVSHDILLLDDEKYFDRLAQDGHALIGAHIGLGTDRELRNQTTGYQYIIPLGAWEPPVVSMGAGVPQGSLQGVQAGNTCAVPYVAALNAHYGQNRLVPLYWVAQQWVDDTFLAAANVGVPRGLAGLDLAIELPMQGILVDQATCSWTNMQISLSRQKAQYWCSEPGCRLWIPTQQVLSTRTGIFWTEQSPAERLAALYMAEPLDLIDDKECLRYMGCDIRPKKGAKAPSNLREIRDDINLSLKRVRLTPDQARHSHGHGPNQVVRGRECVPHYGHPAQEEQRPTHPCLQKHH